MFTRAILSGLCAVLSVAASAGVSRAQTAFLSEPVALALLGAGLFGAAALLRRHVRDTPRIPAVPFDETRA